MKVCIICSDFRESNIILQPWRYIYEISKGLESDGDDVEIISDGYPILPMDDTVNDIRVHRLKKFNALNFLGHRRLVNVLNEKSPDIILSQIGVTSYFFLLALKKINKPIIGLWMGTRYRIKQILDLGLGEIIHNFRYIRLYTMMAMIPPLFIKNMVKLSNLKRIIVLNKHNAEFISRYTGTHDKISIIPPGITNYDFEPPDSREVQKLRKELELKENNFVILYLGSPLTLRGPDILINAISLIHDDVSSLRLIILSRVHTDDLKEQETYIKQLTIRRNIDRKTKIFSGVIDKSDVKNFIALADTVALPFRLVLSDNPISILEVMAQGKTVISTKLDGIPELLNEEKGYLVNPNDPKELSLAIKTLYSNPQMRKKLEKNAKRYMMTYPRWDQTAREIIKVIDDIL
jgi:glycosyltransferase involved in cell wall biosynthesis